MRVLVLNGGSATLKFQLLEVEPNSHSVLPHKLAQGLIDEIGHRAQCRFESMGEPVVQKVLPLTELGAAVREVLQWLKSKPGVPRPDAVGHRVVHGGSRFTTAALIDEQILDELDTLSNVAPLHNPPALNAIHAARREFGDSMPMVAVFDTAFHSTIPAEAATYAIPWELAQKHRIRRYGFHGLACQYDLARYAELTGHRPERINAVILHLGNGCSVTAIRQGRSVETSMGFTPLEGLVMGTRSGDLDPAVLTYLARRENVDAAEVEMWLNKHSGLLGISGFSSDMRKLLETRATDARAKLAVDVFCHRARKYLGAYLAILGGADAIIFSGGIGENAPAVREAICREMEWCGIRLDPMGNDASAKDRCISVAGSAPQVWVIDTDEEIVIALETARVLQPDGSGSLNE